MENIQDYLSRIGFISHINVFEKNKKPKLIEGLTAAFSSERGGIMNHVWIKDGVKIMYGLNEANKPPTLITHPFIIEQSVILEDGSTTTANSYVDQSIIERALKNLETKIIVDAIINNQKINVSKYLN